jgi:hypothetical protein
MLLLARAPRSLPPAWMRWHYAGRDPLAEAHLAMWERLRPRAVYGMVSPLRGLAELLVRQPAARHRATLVFCTGETLDSAGRRLLEDAILSELLPLPGRDAARLIVTSLVSQGTPLIRYEIGDLAVAGPAEPCPCGRTFHRLARIQGRIVDCVRRPDGSLVPPYPIEEAVMDFATKAPRYQVVQRRPDLIEVRLQAEPDMGMADAVRGALARLLGPTMEVEISFAASLDPPPGQKFRLVQGLVGQGPPVSP